MLNINKDEADAASGGKARFGDGSRFIDAGHAHSFDLDVFGEDSLFYTVNRCATREGEEALATELSSTDKRPGEIYRRQQAVRELSQMTELRQQIYACGRPEPVSFGDFMSIASSHKMAIPRYVYISAVISSAVTITLTAAAVFKILPPWPAIIMFLLQLAISALFTARTGKQYSKATKARRSLKGYGRILSLIGENGGFKSTELSEIEKGLKNMKNEIKALYRIINEFDQRNSGLLYIIVNGFMLRDIILSHKIDVWFVKNEAGTGLWLELASKFDVISSFANFAFNNPDFSYPIIDEKVIIKAKNMCHPSIPPEKRSGNNITINGPNIFYIVTGANMAGKSTFIRSVGINMVLASCGAPVCASEFAFHPVTLFTGMRTSDRLREGSSYFHAELARLEKLKKTAEKSAVTLALLDEILKGTNSKDKLEGSALVLKTLVSLPLAGIAATHDLELGALEKEMPERFKNFRFEFEIKDGEMVFDYKLKEGVTKNMNATLLLKKIFPGA